MESASQWNPADSGRMCNRRSSIISNWEQNTMRILLVNPPNSGRSIPEERFGMETYRKIFRGEPLALEILAGNLDGHEVQIVDLKAEPDELAHSMLMFRPDVVGVTAMTCEADATLEIATQVKRSSQATVVIGGVHASNDPEYFNRSCVDYVVVGLGKLSFAELIGALEDGRTGIADIPGIAAIDPAQPLQWTPRRFSNDDLVEQKAPRYDLVERYRSAGQYVMTPLPHNIGFVAASYGCPFDCSFCCVSGLTGGKYLPHSADSVLRDISLLEPLNLIRLIDANAFADLGKARDLCDRVLDQGLKKQFIADVRADTVVRHPEMMELWKRAGLRAVVIGFEEINDDLLGAFDKQSTLQTNSEAVKILHQIGLTIVGDFIISPSYDEEQFEALGIYLEQNKIDLPMLAVLTPLPGTALHRSLKDQIVIKDLAYYTLTNAVTATRLEEKVFYRQYAELVKRTHADAKL